MLNPADQSFADHLANVVPSNRISPVTPAYLEDPRGNLTGAGSFVARPTTVEEVALIVRAASDRRVGIIPYGGGTGLVGGQIAIQGPPPLILSLERMADIRAVDTGDNVLIAEAGAILADVQAAATAVGRLFPLSLASQGSCRIGGNLATNAGGLNVLRYGTARDLCLGIEAVLPSGEIWYGLSRLRKDNTGYDLRNLLIGAEGTLGVITAASLKLFSAPRRIATALLKVPDPAAAVNLLAEVRAMLGETVSAFELIDGTGLEFLSETLPEVRQPLPGHPRWSVLIEIGLAGDADAQAAMERVFEAGQEKHLVEDGVIAASEAQRQEIWTLREQIPEANRRLRAIVSTDISVPVSALPEMIARGHAAIGALGDIRINSFGHVGDGNLHFNAFAARGKSRDDYAHLRPDIEKIIFDLAHELGGSFSAEHGIGRIKTAALAHYADPAKLAAMQTMKAALDPRGIMNPGVLFPLEN